MLKQRAREAIETIQNRQGSVRRISEAGAGGACECHDPPLTGDGPPSPLQVRRPGSQLVLGHPLQHGVEDTQRADDVRVIALADAVFVLAEPAPAFVLSHPVDLPNDDTRGELPERPARCRTDKITSPDHRATLGGQNNYVSPGERGPTIRHSEAVGVFNDEPSGC